MHYLELLAALGAVQGALLLLLIALRYRHHQNLPLALLVLVFSLRLGTIPSWNADVLLEQPWLFPLTTPLPFTFGPLLWWYLRELRYRSGATPRWTVLHFVPFFAEVVLTGITTIGSTSAEWELFVMQTFSGRPPTWLPVRNALKVLVNAVYVGMGLHVAFARHDDAREITDDRGRRWWVRTIAAVPVVVLSLFAFVAVYPGATATLAEGNDLPFAVLAACMSVYIYAISFLVLLFPRAPSWGYRHTTAESLGLSEAEERRLVDGVSRVLEAGAFRDPELSLHALAERLHTHPNRLSAAVNGRLHESVPTVVCRYRLEYFLHRMEEGALKQQTILDLAFDSGFPSKSTFNRVFKNRIGVPPSEYAARFIHTGSPPSSPHRGKPVDDHERYRR